MSGFGILGEEVQLSMAWSGEASGEVMLVQIPGGGKGASLGDVWWKSIRGKGNSVCKGSEAEDSGVLEEQLESQCGRNRVTEQEGEGC